MNWFETEEEKKKRLENASKTLSTGKASEEDKDKMTAKEIEELAERKRKKYEEKTGKKGQKYTHKPKKELSKMNSYIDEHNKRLRDKNKPSNEDKGWFSGLFNKDDKKKGKK